MSMEFPDDCSNLVTKCRDCHEEEHPHLKKARLAKEAKYRLESKIRRFAK
jgi:hypothetical protein